MSSSDWFQPSSSSFHTPQRPSPFTTSSSSPFPAHYHPAQSPSSMQQQQPRARFAGDELDPDDLKMADSIRFLPSFAASPAGKASLGSVGGPGTSGGGGGGGGGSPQSVVMHTVSPGAGSGGTGGAGGGGGGRSPQARFDGSSPRNARTPRHPSHHASSTSSAMVIDDDAPPTLSLRDLPSSPPPSSALSPQPSRPLTHHSSSSSLPLPPSLTPSQETTSLHIFGPPTSSLHLLEPWLAQSGHINAYRPGPEGANWWVVEFANPVSAAWCLRRHGEIVNGRWMVGMKVAGPGSTMGCTVVNGEGSGGGGGGQMTQMSGEGGPGTPMQVKKGNVMKVNKGGQGKTGGGGGEIGWEESEEGGGLVGWVAERLFGR